MDEIDVFISPGAIRGYHVYSTIWEAESGEILTTIQERGNVHDRFAVAVKKERLTVGHLLIEMSKLCWFFIQRQYYLRGDRTSQAIAVGARNSVRFNFQRPNYTNKET